MDRSDCRSFVRLVLGLAAAWGIAALAQAAEQQKNGRDGPRGRGEEVDLFAGIARQEIEVQLIPRDASQCRLLITNKTDRPLSVKMPASFAGVPVLAQAAGLPGPGFGPGGNNPGSPLGSPAGSKDPQRVGGGAPGSFFNVPPESMRQMKLETVCLDHGNPTPRAAIKYEIRPMTSATDKAGLSELCELLGRHEVSHRAAQLAAWHFSNGMSWKALAGLQTRQAIGSIPSYTREEIAAAKKAAEKAMQLHQQQQSKSGTQTSANSSAAK